MCVVDSIARCVENATPTGTLTVRLGSYTTAFLSISPSLSLSPMRHMYSARIVSYADTDRRCYWFGVLCGVVQPAVGEGEYLEVGIDVALAFLRRVIPEDTIKERLNVVGQQKGGNPVGLDEACRAATDLFVSFVASEHMSALLSQMEAAAVPGACTGGGEYCMMHEWWYYH